MTTTITRLFDNYSDAKSAVRDIEALGIAHDDLSIMANDHDADVSRGGSSTADAITGDGQRGTNVGPDDHGDVSRGTSTGALLGGAGGLLAGLGLLAIPGLGPIVAAGWLASTAVGAGIGAAGGAATGGIVGALKNAGHSEEDAHVYSEGVRRGGTLLSARVPDARVAEVEAVLMRHRAVDATTRGGAYRQSGWSRFDGDQPAYTREQMTEERSRYARM